VYKLQFYIYIRHIKIQNGMLDHNNYNIFVCLRQLK